MIKRLLAIFLCVSQITICIACSNQSNNTATPQSSTATASVSESNAASPAESATESKAEDAPATIDENNKFVAYAWGDAHIENYKK